MNKKNFILSVVNRTKVGIGLAQLLAQCPDVSRRTAQRWIHELIKTGLVIADGKGPSRVYKPANSEHAAQDMFPDYIPLARDSMDVLSYINQPIAARKPVGYQSDFLDSYNPNETFYLSESLRRQLKIMGDTGRKSLPAGTFGREIMNRLLIDLSWASSHLEGNTYSLLDTRELIEHGKIAVGKAAIETQMILNHKTAIELLIENAAAIDFNRYTLLNLHSALAENLLPNPADEGRLRQHLVSISQNVFQPLSVPQKIDDMFNLIVSKAQRIRDPFEQAFFVMVHIPYLQPFADVNKRTSRLAANIPLLKHNLCPLTFIDVSEQAYSRAILGVYELTRVELLRDLFIWAYERSTQAYLAIKRDLSEPDPFRLHYRELIKNTINKVIKTPNLDPLHIIDQALEHDLSTLERQRIRAIMIEELQRLHEGVLARYGLRASEYQHWKKITERK